MQGFFAGRFGSPPRIRLGWRRIGELSSSDWVARHYATSNEAAGAAADGQPGDS